MYKKILFTALLIFQIISFPATAQQKGEKVESIKVAYISQKVNLDPPTAERFWPLYNQYSDEMRKVLDSKKATDNRSAEEILDQEQKAIDIKRKYSTIFLKVISNEQLTQLFQAEKEFNRMLLRRMNNMENRQQRREENPGEKPTKRSRINEQR